MIVFKICALADWQAAADRGIYVGSADDARDGFIHLSTADQLPGTLERHFTGQSQLLLVAIPAEQLGTALRWEASRGGALFPHLYGPLTVAAAQQTWVLALGSDGRHVLPQLPGSPTGPAC